MLKMNDKIKMKNKIKKMNLPFWQKYLLKIILLFAPPRQRRQNLFHAQIVYDKAVSAVQLERSIPQGGDMLSK